VGRVKSDSCGSSCGLVQSQCRYRTLVGTFATGDRGGDLVSLFAYGRAASNRVTRDATDSGSRPLKWSPR